MNEKDFEPSKKMEEVMQGLGKQPGRISVMIPVSKIWRWIKNHKKNKEDNNK